MILVDGEASIGRCVAFVDDDHYAALMKKKEGLKKTKFGDVINLDHVASLDKLSK